MRTNLNVGNGELDQEVSLGVASHKQMDDLEPGCYLNLVIRPIPVDPDGPKYSPVTGKTEFAELHHISLGGIVDEHIHFLLEHGDQSDAQNAMIWAQEFEISAAKIKQALVMKKLI